MDRASSIQNPEAKIQNSPVSDSFHILVVDDDEANRESLRRRLERRGYRLAVAVDGPDALQSLAKDTFDLVILDVMMPGMSGIEVLDRIRQTQSAAQLPVIMATAQDRSENVVQALERGANDYVIKPLDFAVVQARVRTQLLLKKSIDQVLELERRLSLRNAELESANQRLQDYAARTARELESAARVQKAFLPGPDPEAPGARFSWVFEPCTELAGDSLNVIRLDADHVAFYILDVSGHGVPASLLAVAATRLLSVTGSGESVVLVRDATGHVSPAQPADVAASLNQRFAFDSEAGQFLTLFYAVLNLKSRDLTYVSAGHPGAIHVSQESHVSDGAEPVILQGNGPPIGIGEEYEQQRTRLADGDRVYVYSDGVTEARNAADQLFGIERLLPVIKTGMRQPIKKSLSLIDAELAAWRGASPSRDDISMLVLECIPTRS